MHPIHRQSVQRYMMNCCQCRRRVRVFWWLIRMKEEIYVHIEPYSSSRVRGLLSFFDSLGHSPNHYHDIFKTFLIAHSSTYKMTIWRSQDYGSMTCGVYCIFYALHRCRVWSFEDIVDYFHGQSRTENDSLVEQLLFGY